MAVPGWGRIKGINVGRINGINVGWQMGGGGINWAAFGLRFFLPEDDSDRKFFVKRGEMGTEIYGTNEREANFFRLARPNRLDKWIFRIYNQNLEGMLSRRIKMRLRKPAPAVFGRRNVNPRQAAPAPALRDGGCPLDSMRKREKLSFPLLLSLDRNRKHNLTHRAPEQANACSGFFLSSRGWSELTGNSLGFLPGPASW